MTIVARRDLAFVPVGRDRVVAHRAFPPARPIAMPARTKRLFDRIVAGSARVSTEVVEVFADLGLFESAELEAARGRLFERHLRQHRGAVAVSRSPMPRVPAPVEGYREIEALLLPHGHLSLVGEPIARAVSNFRRDNWPDLFVIAATSHYAGELSVLTRDVLVGGARASTDRAFVDVATRAYRRRMRADSPWFLYEHSWQVCLPVFSAHARAIGLPLRIAAFMVPLLDAPAIDAFVAALRIAAIAGVKRVCFVASGDLSHLGYGYARGVARQRSRARVLAEVKRRETPILEALCDGRVQELSRRIARSTFCARSQVEALQRHTELRGDVISHEAFLNFRRRRPAELALPFRETDRVFSTATVLFGRKGDARPHLCPRLHVERCNGTVRIVHPCDRSQFEGPAALLDADPRALDVFRLHGLLVHRDRHNLSFRRREAWRQFLAASAKIPYYRSRSVRRWEDIPTIDSTVVKQRWHDFFVEPSPRRRVHVRTSSASSGRGALETVVERGVSEERERWAEEIRPGLGKVLALNRPENTMGAYQRSGRWPRTRVAGQTLLASPGEDLHPIDERVWLRLAARVQAFAPATIHGSPEHLAVFAYVLARHGVSLPSVRRVDLGHNYAWAPYARRIAASFGDVLFTRLHSSELGPLAIECERRRLHLLEKNRYVELLAADGRPAAAGELAEAFYTTLDTRIRPMFRYRQGDVLVRRERPCRCGAAGRIVEYQGRTQDLLLVDRAFVTYPMLDACLADVEPFFVFQLVVATRKAVLRVGVFDRDAWSAFPAAAVRDRLAGLLRRPVEVRLARRLHARKRGKLLGVVNRDRRQAWAHLY